MLPSVSCVASPGELVPGAAVVIGRNVRGCATGVIAATGATSVTSATSVPGAEHAARAEIQSAQRSIELSRLYRVSRYGTGIRAIATCLILNAACGGDTGPSCDYTEVADATNGTIAEVTNLTVGKDGHMICGTFSPDGANTALMIADDDRYRVSVTGATPLLIEVDVGMGLEVLAAVTVRFFDTAATPRLVAEVTPTFAGSLGAFLATLDPGDYDVVVEARSRGAIAGGTIDYKIRFSPMPACDEATGTANYTETNDAGNGMISVDYTKDPQFSLLELSSPETTKLTIETDKHVSISGAIGDGAQSDQYLDRDTYEITTGDSTHELAVRLTWAGTSSDLDYILFDGSTKLTPIAASNLASETGPELAMFAVEPKTKYWLWVGGVMGSTATNYRATLCGNGGGI